MAVRPDLTPNQGKRYRLKLIQVPETAQRFQAYLARELDGGSSPGYQLLLARAQGMDVKIIANIIEAAASREWFSATFMVKEDAPIRTAADLKGKTVGVSGAKTAADIALRAYLLRAGLDPEKDVKVVPISFPTMGVAVRSGKVAVGVLVEPFYSAERAKGGLRVLFNAGEALGYDHDVLDLWIGERLIKAEPEALRAFLADYVAATKYYLAQKEQAKRDLHRAGYVRTPIDIYLKLVDYKRAPDARVNVASLKQLAALMVDKLGWLDKPANVEAAVDEGFLPK
ncbi:MAG: ABC transporter substrate-binding protein [Betaproteobacteria bacterium]|nr:ABC transporter substrate-binding protein [Betaproteobacteria bacterium]